LCLPLEVPINLSIIPNFFAPGQRGPVFLRLSVFDLPRSPVAWLRPPQKNNVGTAFHAPLRLPHLRRLKRALFFFVNKFCPPPPAHLSPDTLGRSSTGCCLLPSFHALPISDSPFFISKITCQTPSLVVSSSLSLPSSSLLPKAYICFFWFPWISRMFPPPRSSIFLVPPLPPF